MYQLGCPAFNKFPHIEMTLLEKEVSRYLLSFLSKVNLFKQIYFIYFNAHETYSGTKTYGEIIIEIIIEKK